MCDITIFYSWIIKLAWEKWLWERKQRQERSIWWHLSITMLQVAFFSLFYKIFFCLFRTLVTLWLTNITDVTKWCVLQVISIHWSFVCVSCFVPFIHCYKFGHHFKLSIANDNQLVWALRTLSFVLVIFKFQ